MRLILALLILSAASPAAGLDQRPVAVGARLEPLPSLDGAAITVSGLSSGGFFAHQFHVAFSEIVQGAGIVAGGPYACAEQDLPFWAVPWWGDERLVAALSVCTRFTPGWFGLPKAPDPAVSTAAMREARRRGAIDDPVNLADDRVWLFSGTADGLVPPSTMAALATVYEGLGLSPPALASEATIRAAHGFPVEEFSGDTRFAKLGCLEEAPPFVIDCDLDAAGRMLRHLLPAGFDDTAGTASRESLLAFDQAPFLDAGEPRTSLHRTGYLYVPSACRQADPGARCRLHVAFHGCSQNFDAVDDDFVWDAGYNRWAEANAIVVLYPQTTAWTPRFDPFGAGGNPKACWDWWGYSGSDYATRQGKQMWAVRGMVDRLLGR